MATKRHNATPAEAAESLAIQALAFLADDQRRLARFFAVTGIGPEEIRMAAREPQFLAGVLEYLAGAEPVLLEFASHLGVDPGEVARALAKLGGRPWERDLA